MVTIGWLVGPTIYGQTHIDFSLYRLQERIWLRSKTQRCEALHPAVPFARHRPMADVEADPLLTVEGAAKLENGRLHTYKYKAFIQQVKDASRT